MLQATLGTYHARCLHAHGRSSCSCTLPQAQAVQVFCTVAHTMRTHCCRLLYKKTEVHVGSSRKQQVLTAASLVCIIAHTKYTQCCTPCLNHRAREIPSLLHAALSSKNTKVLCIITRTMRPLLQVAESRHHAQRLLKVSLRTLFCQLLNVTESERNIEHKAPCNLQ